MSCTLDHGTPLSFHIQSLLYSIEVSIKLAILYWSYSVFTLSHLYGFYCFIYFIMKSPNFKMVQSIISEYFASFFIISFVKNLWLVKISLILSNNPALTTPSLRMMVERILLHCLYIWMIIFLLEIVWGSLIDLKEYWTKISKLRT